jgi:periplasmic protein TonB
VNAQSYTAASPAAKASGAFFRWEIPGQALGVNLHLNIIELIERDALRAGTRFAAGVLLGRFDRGRDLTMTIEHYAAATPERGAADCPFSDSERVRVMLDRWRPGKSRMSILGLYRTCADQEPVLNEDDLTAICSSVGPGSDPSTGTSYAESADRRVTAIREGFAAVSGQADRTASPGTEPTERVFLLIEPKPNRVSTAVLYLAREGEIVHQSPPIAFNRGEIAKTAAPAPPPNPQAARTAKVPQGVVIRDVEEPQAALRWRLPDLLSYFNNFYRLLAAAAVLVLLIAGYVELRNGNPPAENVPYGSTETASDMSASPDLGLKLEKLGTDLRLKWDTSSPAFLKASQGHLEITDGAIHKNVDLNASDLRGGSIVYSPLTNDVVLKLEIDSANSPPVSESVRTVGGMPSMLSSPGFPDVPPLPDAQIAPPGLGSPIDTAPAPVIAPTQTAVKLPPISDASSAEIPARHGIDLPKAGVTDRPAPSYNAPAAKRLAQPTTPHFDRTPIRHVDQATPGIETQAAEARTEPLKTTPLPTLSISGMEPTRATSEPQPAPAPSVARTPPQEASPAALPEPERKGGVVQPAQLISHPDPVYPPEARKQGISGAVEVRFKIGTDGNVYNVAVVRGPSALAQAAIDAVQARRYKPARVDGIPTETQASAIFNFTLN